MVRAHLMVKFFLPLLLVLTLAAARRHSRIGNQKQLLRSRAGHSQTTVSGSGSGSEEIITTASGSGSGSEETYSPQESASAEIGTGSGTASGCCVGIADPLEVGHVFYNSEEHVISRIWQPPPWKIILSKQAENCVTDGPLGWRSEDGGDIHRPSGVFLTASWKQGGPLQPVANYHPFHGKFGTDYYQAKIDIHSAFVLDYHQTNPKRLDECIQFTCYPQVCFVVSQILLQPLNGLFVLPHAITAQAFDTNQIYTIQICLVVHVFMSR